MTGQDELNENDGHIDLERLPNTRDLGYLRTGSGARIRPRRLIRSGALAEASDEDIRMLVEVYQVKTVIDLRTPDEQANSPDPMDKMPSVDFFDAPILGFSTTGITREDGLPGMIKTFSGSTHDPRQLMIELYSNMFVDDIGIRGFTRFFEILAQSGEGAVLWHCSAGKDRAGLATVLLLHILGVSRDAILSDYLVTNRYLANRANDLTKLIPPQYQEKAALQSLQILNSADAAFLDAGIVAVEQEYGSLDTYLAKALGLDEYARKTLCCRYLE